MNRKLTVMLEVLSVLLCALGSLPFLYFFVTVDQGTPLSVLIVGVAMISVSGLLSIITVEDNSYNFHFIFFLYFSIPILEAMFFASLVGQGLPKKLLGSSTACALRRNKFFPLSSVAR